MKFAKNNWIVYFIIMLTTSKAQVTTIQFSFTYSSTPLIISDSANLLHDSTHLKLSELKFYISTIQFLKNKKKVCEEKNSFHLIDATKPSSQKISIKTPSTLSFDELKFQLGIDSVTNVSGALGGDLDPTKGMYWAWQSGYINFKLEGTSDACKSRNHEFQFHVGGYQQPFYCLKSLTFAVKQAQLMTINLDVKKILDNLDLKTHHHIMSPNKEAVILAQKISEAFSCK